MLNIFTIAFNCVDDLRAQWTILRKLRVPFRWSIVEGYAEPIGCTSWCRPLGDRWQRNGGSVDGTRDLIADLARDNPDIVSAQLAAGAPWPGKLAMCNAALVKLSEPGTLVEIDADEFWTAEALERIPNVLQAFPQAGGMQFHCRLWVSDRHVTFQRADEHGYGHMPYEWFRAWRYDGEQRFQSHEPPILQRCGPLIHRGLTRAHGLTFEHRSYVRRDQVALKEEYYGYAGAVDGWERMRAVASPVVRVADFLPWVKTDTRAVTVL